MGITHRGSGKSMLLFCSALLIWWSTGTVLALGDHDWAKAYPQVVLKTQDNKEVRFYDDLIKDKIVIINFMYTQCKGICRQGTQNLLQVQRALGERLGREVFIYSITLDPEHDTPEVLKAYAKEHGAKWTFLTGKATDIDALRRKLGLANQDPELRRELGLTESIPKEGQGLQHSGTIAIGCDAFNRWSKKSILSKPEQILQEIERLKPPAAPVKQ